MFVGARINQLLEERNETKSHLYTTVGISKSSLDNIIKEKNSPSITVIENIADFFRVPIDYFFEREVEISQSNAIVTEPTGTAPTSTTSTEVELLRSLLNEKERTIQILLKQSHV